MSIPLPLTVRLSTSRTVRDVTADVRDLRFGWSEPGGYTSCQIQLDRPLSVQPDEIAYYQGLTVYDARNGEIVFDGQQEDPARSAGAGQVWDLTAMGGQARTQDVKAPYVYIDRDMARWAPVEVAACPGGQRSAGEDEGIFPGEQSLIHRIPNNTPVKTNTTHVSSRYLWIYRTGQHLARVDARWDSGRTTVDLRIRTYVRAAGTWSTSATNVRDDAANVAGGGSSPKIIGTDWTAVSAKDAAEVRIQWTGANNTVGDDVTWGAWADLVVLGTRYDAGGTELVTTADYPTNYVLGHEVVADVLGRLLPLFDGDGASIVACTHQIQQLAYITPVDARRILSDVLGFEAGHTWRVWERNGAGLYRFEFTTIPTEVRYEADLTDGYTSLASADGLYDEVSVGWRDSVASDRFVVRTQSVPTLADAGFSRRAYIDIGDSTLADAQRAGDQWLSDHQYAPNGGRLTVKRPILDLQTGRMVMPWEIRPGLIRVRGILPRPDALNATARDGVTVFRIRGMDFSASQAAAVLDLDSYAPSTARTLADVQRLMASRGWR